MITDYLYILPGAFLVPIIHSWVKGVVSARLGDPTPKKKGYLSRNPLQYFEIIGFILIMVFGYSWGKPVPTSPFYYRDRRSGVLLVHLVPSMVSLLLGVIAVASLELTDAMLVSYFSQASAAPGWYLHAANAFIKIFYHFARLNIGMALFALIPIYPLNGVRILQVHLKPDQVARMNHYEKFLQLFLILFLVMGFFNMIFDPIVGSIVNNRFLTMTWTV